MKQRDKYVNEVVEALQKEWKKGLKLFEEVLHNPGSLEARKELRELERKHREKRKGLRIIPFSPGKEHPVLDCEMHLLRDPWDVECLIRLAELLRGEKPVARWLYEDVEALVGEKADAKMLERLAEGYESVNASGRAAAIYRRLNAESPRPEYESKLMRAEAHATSKGGKGSYRDFIRDKEEAARLEESGRLPKTSEDYVQRANEKERELGEATTPEARINVLREVAEDYLRAGDSEKARETYGRILNVDPDNPHAVESLLKMDMASAKDKSTAVEMGIAGYERLVKLEPTNMEYSVELGRLHLEAGEFQKAVLAFQRAAKHPNMRKAVRMELAKCFLRQGLPAIAAKEYEEVLADSSTEGAERTEAMYALADCHSRMGHRKEAFDLFAEVYRNHADFKDVMERVLELNEKLSQETPPSE
jgi:tetratricopeptide (TPR) repeat protein